MSGSVPLVITPGKTPNVLLTKDSLEVEPGAYFQQAYSGAEPQSPGHNLAAIVEQNHLAPPELTPSSSASDDIVAETKPDELDKAEDRAALAAIPDSERSTPIPISQTRFSSSPTLLNSPSGLFSDPALLSPAEKSESGGYFGFRKNSVISGLEFAFPSPHEEGTKPTLQDVVRGLSLLEGNAEDLEELNLSYCDACTGDHVKQLARGLQRNTHLKRLALKGVGLGTGAVVDIAQALEANSTLEILNLERNRIGAAGIKAIADMVRKNSTLLEVRLNAQTEKLSTDIEREVMFALEENQSINRFSLQINDPTIRDVVDRHIHRNREITRKKHLEAVRSSQTLGSPGQ